MAGIGGRFLGTAATLACAVAEPLLLTPLLRAGKVEEARQASRVVIDGVFMGHSGFFSVPSASGQRINNMFTWFQPCLDGCDPAAAPFIHWFNGGPGSPDTVGAMNQIGNWYVDRQSVMRERCFSWCRTSNCLFIDSPVMTGFSYQVSGSGVFDGAHIEYTLLTGDATKQTLDVLLQFLTIWPEYVPAPYYVHGLSYGGKYVPQMAQRVVEHNKAGGVVINIKGLAAGDPVLDNAYQYPTYATTLYSMGLLMEEERDVVDGIMAEAARLNDVDCWASFLQWNRVFNDDGGSSCEPHCEFLFRAYTGSSNTENLLLGAQPENWEYFKSFLASHAAELHIEGWPSRNMSQLAEGGEVYNAMVRSGDFCKASAPLYTKLFLNDSLDVFVYTSNLDPLLGPPTTAAGVRAAWDYAERHLPGGAEAKRAFYAQRKAIWRVAVGDTEPAGYARCLEGAARFCYVVVRNAGHETVPYAPRAAYDLNLRLAQRRSFEGGSDVPDCAACGGAPPLAGSALPSCNVGPLATFFM